MKETRTPKLDEELAQALADTAEADTSTDEPSSAPGLVRAVAPARRPPQRSLALLLTLLAMVAGVVCLFLFGMNSGAIYAMKVDELMTARDKFAGKKVRVEGELVPGTLVKRDKPCEYRFTISGPNEKLPVRYPQCVVADSFRDVPSGGVEVTVEGKLSAAGEFEATLVMAKCTSKYDKDTHEMKDGPKPEGPISGVVR
jgi:cytochrome c-type biogenesis protein CcmE